MKNQRAGTNRNPVNQESIAKVRVLDHIQPVIITFQYLFIYKRNNIGVRWSI